MSEERVVRIPVDIRGGVAHEAGRLESQARGIERREHPRVAVSLPAQCQIDGVPAESTLGDLSVGGLRLLSHTPINPGARFQAVLALPFPGGTRYCSLSGRVVWSRGDEQPGGRWQAGIQFDADTTPADRQVVSDFLHLWGVPAPKRGP